MHSQLCADRMRARYSWQINPAPIPATNAWTQLTDLLGEVGADDWFDGNIANTDEWGIITTKMQNKISELTAEAAHSRIDRSQQAHPGIV
jgi:hypothetical protein